MKKLTIFIAGVAMMALASPLYAAGESPKTISKSMTGSAQVQSAEELKDMQVFSQDGEKLGPIISVTKDPVSGQIQFITFSKGGFAGVGGEEIALPPQAFRIDQTYRRATLLVSESKLDYAPQQETMSDNEFQRNLEQYYGVAPRWQDNSREMGIEPSLQMDADQPVKRKSPHSN
ncbi:MAG: PRC-barrel domain-containing protein [Desulforhopalus sp.]